MIVPHGVRRTGSHDERPVTIVVAFDAAGFDRSTRCTAGFEVSSSQTNKYFGLSSSGQSAIWSAADATELETSETLRPWATTNRLQVVGAVVRTDRRFGEGMREAKQLLGVGMQ